MLRYLCFSLRLLVFLIGINKCEIFGIQGCSEKKIDLVDQNEEIIIQRGKDKAYVIAPLNDADRLSVNDELIRIVQEAEAPNMVYKIPMIPSYLILFWERDTKTKAIVECFKDLKPGDTYFSGDKKYEVEGILLAGCG